MGYNKNKLFFTKFIELFKKLNIIFFENTLEKFFLKSFKIPELIKLLFLEITYLYVQKVFWFSIIIDKPYKQVLLFSNHVQPLFIK